jgi:hypothetical protein
MFNLCKYVATICNTYLYIYKNNAHINSCCVCVWFSQLRLIMAVICVSRLVADILTYKPGFDLRPVKFMFHKVGLEQFILLVPLFIAVSINPSVLHIDIFYLLPALYDLSC